MLWIEDIVESTQTPPFLTNSKIDMAGFVDLHKMIARKNAFSALPSAWNEGELEGGAKSGGLKCQFSQVEVDLDLQEILKLVPIPMKRAPKKKLVVMKDEDEGGDKVGQNWVDVEILRLIVLKGEMELIFAKNAKKKVN